MNEPLTFVVATLLAYLIGTLLGGRIVPRLRGINLRASGSGNIGATNALRAGGIRLALPVLLIDMLKGVLAVLLIPPLVGASDDMIVAYACGAAVAVGHCYPVWERFHGGKGVATLTGVFAVLLPWAFPFLFLVFALTVMASGYVSLASMLAALAAVVYGIVFQDALPAGTLAFVVVVALLVIVKHHSNITNLVAGTEHRFERAALLRRWLKRHQN